MVPLQAASHFSRFPWLQQPSRSRPKQAWALDQTQEVVLANEKVEVTGAVAAVLLVVEVNPEPSASPCDRRRKTLPNPDRLEPIRAAKLRLEIQSSVRVERSP
jgi:hypothetical protein